MSRAYRRSPWARVPGRAAAVPGEPAAAAVAPPTALGAAVPAAATETALVREAAVVTAVPGCCGGAPLHWAAGRGRGR